MFALYEPAHGKPQRGLPVETYREQIAKLITDQRLSASLSRKRS